MSISTDPVTNVLDAYKAAVYAKDVEAFCALYDPDVRVFDLWGRWSHDGAAWREMVQGWFGSLGSESVVVAVDGLHSVAGGDLIAAHAFMTFAARSPDGTELRSMNNRLSIVLRQRGDAWKIVHQHTSAPVDMATSKVMLKR